MDSRRIEVTPQQITEYFAKLFETISGAQAHSVFNMGEMGHREWTDAHEKSASSQASIKATNITRSSATASASRSLHVFRPMEPS
jgi:hypothetical protein